MMMYSCPYTQKSKFAFNCGVRPLLASWCLLSVVHGFSPNMVHWLDTGDLSLPFCEDLAETSRMEGNIYRNELCVGRRKPANSRQRWSWLLIKEISYFPAS